MMKYQHCVESAASDKGDLGWEKLFEATLRRETFMSQLMGETAVMGQ
jgi:hypothetical protein